MPIGRFKSDFCAWGTRLNVGLEEPSLTCDANPKGKTVWKNSGGIRFGEACRFRLAMLPCGATLLCV
jgi:hypothetical protein